MELWAIPSIISRLAFTSMRFASEDAEIVIVVDPADGVVRKLYCDSSILCVKFKSIIQLKTPCENEEVGG